MNSKLKNQEEQSFLLPKIVIGIMVLSILYFGVYRVWTQGDTLNTASAFMLMAICIVIGEVFSTKTNAFVPSMFISAVLFVLGFWTFFPKDILQLGGVAENLPTFFVTMMVVHLGTMLDFDELKAQWKTVVVTLVGMLGIILAIMTVGGFILGFEKAAIAAPPLTGGVVAALMMQGVAGNEDLFILAMAVYVLQGFVGYPLMSMCLKKEGKEVLEKFRKGEYVLEENTEGEIQTEKKMKFIDKLPPEYKSDTFIILQIVVLVVVSGYLEILSNGIISGFVWALLVGVVAAEIGIIDVKPLERSNSLGYVYTIIMMFVFAGLNTITPAGLVQLLKDFAVLIALATAGIAIFSIPIGKKLGLSTAMSFALGLGSIAGGFPASYVLSVEAARVTAKTPEEYKVLEEHLLPKTLVSGFVSATSGSVLVAGIVISLFFT